jgi:hypothetical protein
MGHKMSLRLRAHLFPNIFGDEAVKIYPLPLGVVDKGVMDFLIRWLSSIWPLRARPAIAMPEEAYKRLMKAVHGPWNP